MIPFVIFLFGIAFGSFLNVLILRIPKEQSVAFPASHCYSCDTPLKWYHNIPVFSWIFLRGRCAFCNNNISVQYPLIEISCGLLFLICYLRETSIYLVLISGIIFSLLLALSIVDLRYKAVPDSLSLPALLLVFVHPEFLLRAEHILLFVGGFALLRIFVSFLAKKEAMGEADIIIAGIIGGMVGISHGLVAIFISALLALPAFIMVSKKDFELPFIPFLAMGLFIVYVFDSQISLLVKYIYE